MQMCVCLQRLKHSGESQPAGHRACPGARSWHCCDMLCCSWKAHLAALKLALVNEQQAGTAAQFCKAQREKMIHALPDLSLTAFWKSHII